MEFFYFFLVRIQHNRRTPSPPDGMVFESVRSENGYTLDLDFNHSGLVTSKKI